MTVNEDNGKVQYTIKELLQDIRLSIAAMDTKLDSKADKADVRVLESRVDQVSTDQQLLRAEVQADRRIQTSHTDHRRFLIPLVISICGMLLSPILWFATSHLLK